MKNDTKGCMDTRPGRAWVPSVHAGEVGALLQDGGVTPTGDVGVFGEKRNTERGVPAEQAFTVDAEPALRAFTSRTDAEIAQAAAAVLYRAGAVSGDTVQVVVEGGWITLSGQVDWQDERQAAWDAIRRLVGVTGVSDQIVIRPPVTTLAVKSAIDAALQRRAAADASAVSVSVDGADVTLTGSVGSFVERETASDSAWATPGVRNVINEITLTC